SALKAWFGGSAYARAASSTHVRAEVPFVVGIEDVYLEGSIDLLCADGPIGLGTRAVLFDYKTGGHDDETPQARYYKHLLQAQCYAYALLKQGCVSVDAHFVRVQRAPMADFEPYPGTYAGTAAFADADTVDYRFTAADLLDLETIIAETYRRHKLSG
ncbi:MAG: PD-(D/E)XK nuclease family protein, partial [Eggerthellaceae bacterium]|nr:PD-(D/E)XK nuclease family protein [Eggerthellaceae bacterium]